MIAHPAERYGDGGRHSECLDRRVFPGIYRSRSGLPPLRSSARRWQSAGQPFGDLAEWQTFKCQAREVQEQSRMGLGAVDGNQLAAAVTSSQPNGVLVSASLAASASLAPASQPDTPGSSARSRAGKAAISAVA
jgi:hypothetical protein